MKHDKTLIEKRFERALARYNTMAVVQKQIARELANSIPESRQFTHGVEIGAGSGFLTHHLVERFPMTRWIANDITPRSQDFMPPTVEFIAADGEHLEIPIGTDIITSASTVQWFDDLPQFIGRAHHVLSDNGGTLAISTFGQDNFREISETLHYYTMEQLCEIFTAKGFEIIDSREWIEQLTFETPVEVLRHIKSTGVNAISTNRWTQRRLQEFISLYPRPATLTFHPIIIVAQKSGK